MTRQQLTDVSGIATSDIPLYATQGGGYATFEGGQYVWHSEIPSWLNAEVGDPIPKEWSVTSANAAARRVIEEDIAWNIHEFGSPDGFCGFCANSGCGYCFGDH